MNRIFNADTLVEVQIVDKQSSFYWYYQEGKKSFWGNRKAGHKRMFGDYKLYTTEEVEAKNLIVENNTVYCLPYVKLYFAGDRSYMKTFKTYEEAMTWGSKMKENINRKIELEWKDL